MPLDTARALLINNAYRYVTRSDPTIRVRFPGAQEIIIETNLSEGAANAFADALFAAVSGTNISAFTFTIEDLIFPEDMLVSPPRFTMAFDRHPATAGVTYTATSVQPDYFGGTTTITVRGS